MVASDTWNMIDGLPYHALVTSEFGQVWANTKMGTVVPKIVRNHDVC